MIDNWFKKDLEKIYKTHQLAVFIDESKEAGFLLDVVKDNYKIFTANTELDELKIKYEIEKSRDNGDKYFIYTTTPREDLKFIREYCETNGAIEIKYLQNYVREKVHKNLNLNLNLEKEELISAAKVSIGKDQTYWIDLTHKGSSEIFDLEKELLPFLHNPERHLSGYDETVKEIFSKSLNNLIGQTYVKKPASTLATEVVKHLFNGLVKDNPNNILLEVYNTWLDSNSYRSSFETYLRSYKLPADFNAFKVHPSHPFEKIDKLWIKDLGKNIYDKKYVADFLPKLNQRISTRAARNLNIEYWNHIKILLEFDDKNINQIASFDEAVTFYTKHFYKVDTAIRKLYACFLQDEKLIEPLQNYYKNLSDIFLDKWFKYADAYTSNQTGRIQEILDNSEEKTAIIVGDGVSYEFAQDIISAVPKEYQLSKDANFLFAGLPSVTEHNMSQLYVDTGDVLPTKQDRENYLQKRNSDKDIGFIDLERVTELTDKPQYLICSHKDPDKLGETYQQSALKYFDKVALLYAEKIAQLLKNGYQNVYLVTDHGFVLTGVLTNSDKIEVDFKGTTKKNERYITTKTKQDFDKDLLREEEVAYGEFNYIYFARRLGPFKSPGVYGFSHGGISPQETILPFLKWAKTKKSQEFLGVSIINKKDLKEVTGDIYSVKLKAEVGTDDLFTTNRKVMLMFFSNGVKNNESDIFTIDKGGELRREFHFGSNTEIELKVLDAITREQLDKITIKKSSARNLGGLL
ncbi:PglZ domain-containing protein [Salinimicrobium sp. CDJ15-81-2]|nr:PglZ domain-containing protein [Salinimicrobium nanhaiense]